MICQWQTSERYRTGSMIQRSCNSQAESIEADVDVSTEADGRAHEFALVAPGATADNAVIRIGGKPSRCIRWRAVVILLPAILDPLPDVAEHVVKPESVWRE